MSVIVTDNTAVFTAQVKQRSSLALRFLTQRVADVADPRTPKKLGNLRRNRTIQILGLRGTIRWAAAYAIFQENKTFARYTTPGTGPHFAANAVKDVVQHAEDEFRKAGLI